MKRIRNLAVLLLATALLVGCGAAGPTQAPPSSTPATSPSKSPPTAAPSVDQAAIYAAIERQVEAIRELKPTATVDPVLLDPAALQKTLADATAEDATADQLPARGRLLIALGLLPAGADLAALTTAFQNGQIAGFYLPEDGRLYVVSRSGGIGATEKTTFAHEYTHALQDQHFPLLDELGVDKVPQGDRDLGQLALIEGDATVSMTYWAQKNLSTLELLQLLGSSLDPGQLQALNSMPAFLRETALFPYEAGLRFAMQLQMQGGWDAVNAAFATPPASTEQILHPDKYLAGEAPVAVTLPDVRRHASWARAGRSTRRTRSASSSSSAGWPMPAAPRHRPAEPRLPRLPLPVGAVTASRSTTDRPTPGASSCTPPGTARPTRRNSWMPRARRSRHWDPPGPSSGRADPLEVWVVLGSDAATVAKLQAAAGLPN